MSLRVPLLALAALLAAAVFASPVVSSAGAVVTVSKDAGSQPVIVVPDGAGAPMQLAAQELQRYIERMTQVRLKIVAAAEAGRTAPAQFVLVRVDANAAATKTPPSDAPLPAPGSDAYAIRAAEGRAAIIGGSERAVLFGVYDLLERLGCRWFGPAEEWVPQVTKLEVPPLDVAEKPGLTWRGLELISGSTPAIVDWMAKMRLNVAWPEGYTPNKDMTADAASMKSQGVGDMIARGQTIFWGGHILPILFPIEKYKDHPEYFALIKGKRLNPAEDIQNQNQLCVGNPAVLSILAGNTVQFLRNHPWIDVLFVWAGDTTQWCECDRCRALLVEPDKTTTFGGLDRAPLYTRMIKAIAEQVEKDLPGRKVAFNHYYNLENIPTGKDGSVLKAVLPPGWVLSAVDDYHQCDRHPIRDKGCPRGKRIEPIARMWSPRYKDSVSWSYYFAWNFMMGLPLSEMRKIPDDFQFVRSLGINGVVDNVTLNPGSLHWYNNQLNFYMYGKASWNPDLDVDKTVADYIAHYYGPAAEPMAKVWTLLEESTRKYGLDPAFMPAEAALARPEAIHGRMRDIEELPAATHGAGSARQIRFLVPNQAIYERLTGHLREAEGKAVADTKAPYGYRVAALGSVIADWEADKRKFTVFGFLNGGGEGRDFVYRHGAETRCNVVSGNNLGDCFWSKPRGTPQLASVGDSAQVRVKINKDTGKVGSPLYRAGPGLYQSKDQSTACGVEGGHSLSMFISNLGDDQNNPRQVIVQAHDGKFATGVKSSKDNAWQVGQYVTLRIDYVSDDGGKHTYRYGYDAGAGWVDLGQFVFADRLPFVAPHFHFCVINREQVKYPIDNWAAFTEFSVKHGK